MAEVNITAGNFEAEVLRSDVPVLIDFWASWCGPCRRMLPVVEEIATELEGKVKVGKINIDEEKELAAQFQVMSIPTFVVVKDGKITQAKVGAMPKSALLAMLEA